ncbi:Histidine kinase [Verrucomicrobium sp. GAS474]|uniref:sensor histidine kinase n=1 Tax=Verrucomicrobium sp. GAS474 TaxID=1882831 RepID=UPI00087D5AF1|nr:histidine kinase [Verrucomicrobium sp. GAS474]SDT87647.1 Histidine kinase [Verrucomicrobium sp. GAS474]
MPLASFLTRPAGPASMIRSLWRWQLVCWLAFLLFEQVLFGTFFPMWGQRLPITVGFALALGLWTTAIEFVYRAIWPPAGNPTNFLRTVLFSLVACLPISVVEMDISPHLYRAVGADPELIYSLCFIESARISSYLFWFGTPFVWCLSRFFFLEWTERLRQEREAARTLIASQHRELSLLRSQLNVHFLFNALNSLIAYADYDPKQLKPLVHAMSDYLRFCLEAREEKAPLQQEIDAVGNYLKIEHLRHLDALVYEIDCTPEAAGTHAPIPILQPLIENALRYGLKTSPRPLRIRVTARVEDGHLHAEIANTGKWLPGGKSDSTGVGLANLRRKLDLLYPDRSRLTHESEAGDGWVRARIILPVD